MRFVNLNNLVIPSAWHGRAQQALSDLRKEIAAAEMTAIAAGADPTAARKAAISDGLNRPARKKIWRDLSPQLKALHNDKCWYSESKNPSADKDVDHFRPKNRVAEDNAHEGYWWLAFSPQNFRYSSQWCNQRRVDVTSKTSGGKWDHFPIDKDSVRARQESDDVELESPDLLDPTDPQDWRLLSFRVDGHPVPAKPAGTNDYRRAATSIEIYHLHCKELVDDRRAVAGRIQRLVQSLERLRSKIDDLKIRKVYLDRQIELLEAISPDAEYSAAALAYARSEIYTLQRGHQVKREWLEEMLS
jgi:uncharacterized protein (TIGR02646 family)